MTIQVSSNTILREINDAVIGGTSGYFSTSGSRIVDAATGQPVTLVGANWFGAESDQRIPGGLWARNYQDMMDDMVAAGLNVLRMPLSPAVLWDTPVTTGMNAQLNPDLFGRTAIEIMDTIIDYAGQIGLRIILDMHRITPGVGKQENGLWFNDDYSLQDLAADWQTLAARYAGNPTVIGADLFNEPSGAARWGDDATDPSLDWAAAATYLGDAIHEVNPDLLILVEGVHIVDNKWYWVGGNLRGAADDPIVLGRDDKLVYAPHDYPASVVDVDWLRGATAEDMVALFRTHWGYLAEGGTAPILVGETGAKFLTDGDIAYMDALFGYLASLNAENPGSANVTWWGWNPNSGDTGGLLTNDWLTLHDDKLAYLQSMGGTILPTTEEAALWNSELRQTVVLDFDGVTAHDRSYFYTVEGLTATEGEDFIARDGVIQVRAGQSSATIDIVILPDDLAEGTETLRVKLFFTNGKSAGVIDIAIENGAGQPPLEIDPEPQVEAGFEMVQQWGREFFGRIEITNSSDSDIEDWQLAFAADGFTFLRAHNVGDYTIMDDLLMVAGPVWNQHLEAGETIRFGVNGLLDGSGALPTITLVEDMF